MTIDTQNNGGMTYFVVVLNGIGIAVYDNIGDAQRYIAANS